MSSREQGVNVKSMVRQTNDQCPRNEPSTADDGCVPSCWICLEEGPDQSGKGLVRDCSCRGESGFAHLGCLVKYAKQTSLDMTADQLVISDGLADNEVAIFTVHWEKCSICHQLYQGELALDLANSLLLFIDGKKSEKSWMDQMRYMNTLKIKIDVFRRILANSNNADLESEGKQTANKLLAMAQQLKVQVVEASAHERIGHFDGLSKENYKVGIKHYKKAIKIYKSMGETEAAKSAESDLAFMKSKNDGTGPESSREVVLKNDQDLHDYYVREDGERSMRAITSGSNLAISLNQLGHCIESERLLTKQMRLSLQINGREHYLTETVTVWLEIVKQRKVTISSQPGVEFEALRYEAAGDEYAVRKALHGTVNGIKCVPPGSTKGEIFSVASKDILWREGTPVICHGLKKASHLNGKTGDARSYNYDSGRYGVHFEHAGKLVAVKKENLRIVFELPN